MTNNRNVIYIDKTNFKEDDVTGTSIIVAPRQDKDVRLSYHSTTDRKSVSFIILFTGILTASIILRKLFDNNSNLDPDQFHRAS